MRHDRAEPADVFRRSDAAANAGEDGFLRDEAVELLREKQQLEQAMESRPVIDMARGVLVASFACDPEDAWEILVTVSQHSNVKLRDVADAVTSAATGKPMPAGLQEQLASAVQARQAGRRRSFG
ncbi:ANTAR domain-containing protein [Streptomyces cadmiisoli]|uniref:ANTAR domain-containing protein n=1 Tax=Streptomyces cadmiisoli TaxID=2184053 RepID=UPI00364EE470